MSLDEAIQEMNDKIKTADIQNIKDASFMPAIELLNSEGLDIQVFVYDKDAPPLKG